MGLCPLELLLLKKESVAGKQTIYELLKRKRKHVWRRWNTSNFVIIPLFLYGRKSSLKKKMFHLKSLTNISLFFANFSHWTAEQTERILCYQNRSRRGSFFCFFRFSRSATPCKQTDQNDCIQVLFSLIYFTLICTSHQHTMASKLRWNLIWLMFSTVHRPKHSQHQAQLEKCRKKQQH